MRITISASATMKPWAKDLAVIVKKTFPKAPPFDFAAFAKSIGWAFLWPSNVYLWYQQQKSIQEKKQ